MTENKIKEEVRKKKDTSKIIDAFYLLLNTRRHYDIREYEIFRRELFLYLPEEGKEELRNEGRTKTLKTAIKEIEKRRTEVKKIGRTCCEIELFAQLEFFKSLQPKASKGDE